MSTKRYDDSQQQQSSSFKVFIRVRPYSQQQLLMNNISSTFTDYLTYNQSQIFLKLKSQTQCFTFDHIYHPETTQQQIFSSIADDIIDNSFVGMFLSLTKIGINGTIFCYGQTSSGKTHTIIGDYNNEYLANQGLLPRILRQVIRRRNAKISQITTSNNIDIRIKISMVQIYNQKVIDLFDLNKRDLKLRENKKQGVFIEFVTQKYIVNVQQAMDYVKLGLENRTVGRTNMNQYSSRSHMVFIITVHETNFHTREARSAKITLTDLAGNEKISKTGVQGKMLIEAKKINTSLSTLGKVIQALSESKTSHVPYRDSKLTRILQESIGGNSLTRLIINVSPSDTNQYETITSLRFGSRAKLIKNKPKANKQYTIEQLLMFLEKAQLKIKQQVKVIEQLKRGQIGRFDRRNGGYSGLVGYEKSITMHLIGDDDDYSDETLSNMSKSIVKSTLSNQDKHNVSIFEDTEMVSTQTLEFTIEGQSSQKKIRKPTLSLSKSLKVFPTLDLQSKDLDEDKLYQSQYKYTQPKKKSQKSVKIVDDRGFNEQKDHNQNKIDQYDFKNRTIISQQQIKQQLKQQIREQLKQQLAGQIKQQIKQKLQQQLKSEISLLQLELNTMKAQLLEADNKVDEMQLKFKQNLALIEQQKQTIKAKDQQIAGLREKYNVKKSQINKEINKLKNFWLNIP